MTKINQQKKRGSGWLIGLLGCYLQIATVCIPACAFLGRWLWLMAEVGGLALPCVVLLVPTLVDQLKSGSGASFVIKESTRALNLPYFNTPTYCVWYWHSKNAWGQNRSDLKLLLCLKKKNSVLVESNLRTGIIYLKWKNSFQVFSVIYFMSHPLFNPTKSLWIGVINQK